VARLVRTSQGLPFTIFQEESGKVKIFPLEVGKSMVDTENI
jgi:hypothetical protein